MTADEEANEPMHPDASNESTLVLALSGSFLWLFQKAVPVHDRHHCASYSARAEVGEMVADTIRFPGLYRKRKDPSHGDAEFIVDYRSYAKALH